MARKVQIWLRPDQAQCAIGALEYAAARFKWESGEANRPAVRFGLSLATERVDETADVIRAALAKVEG